MTNELSGELMTLKDAVLPVLKDMLRDTLRANIPNLDEEMERIRAAQAEREPQTWNTSAKPARARRFAGSVAVAG